MALTPRHRWCIERIKHCFHEQEVDDAKVQGFIRKPQVISKFNSLFAGDGKSAIFVHFQENVSIVCSMSVTRLI
jgi:dynein heavy chain